MIVAADGADRITPDRGWKRGLGAGFARTPRIEQRPIFFAHGWNAVLIECDHDSKTGASGTATSLSAVPVTATLAGLGWIICRRDERHRS